MRKTHSLLATLTTGAALPCLMGASVAWSAEAPAATDQASEQVVVPQVDRREVKLPSFPSNDFELGVFGGSHSTQNFGASMAAGLRLGYHFTEDFFAEASLGRTRVSDEAFRRILPGGIFSKTNETLQYVNVSGGVNVLPGEVFVGKDFAMPYYLFVLGGVGTTSFNGKRYPTFNGGWGMKVFLRDWCAFRLDIQDHVFSMDLLGKRERTQNYELTAGLSFLF